jgi:hypothetical protein
MKRADFFKEGNDGPFWFNHFSACMNERYFAKEAKRFGRYDKITRVVMGLVAIASVLVGIFSLPQVGGGAHVAWISVGLSVFGLCVAYVLNVIPFKDNEILNREFQRQWNDLRYDLDLLESEIRETGGESVKPEHMDRFQELLAKKKIITSNEPPQDRKELLKCQKEERIRRHGPEFAEWDAVKNMREEKEKERQSKEQQGSATIAANPH